MSTDDANPDGQNSANLGLAFYRPDYGLDLGPDNKPTGSRSNVRGPDGNIAWFCSQHGRLFRRQYHSTSRLGLRR